MNNSRYEKKVARKICRRISPTLIIRWFARFQDSGNQRLILFQTSNIHRDLLVYNRHPSPSSSSLLDDTTSIHLAQSDNEGTKQDTHPIYEERDRCLVDDRETDTKSLSNDCEKENIDSNEVPAAQIRGIHTNNSQDCPSKLKKYSERADFTNESYEPPIKIPKSVDGMKIVPVLSRKPIKKSHAMRPPTADWVRVVSFVYIVYSVA